MKDTGEGRVRILWFVVGRAGGSTFLGLSLALERDGELEVVAELCDRVGTLHRQNIHVRHACKSTVWRCLLIYSEHEGRPAHSLLAPSIYERKNPFTRSTPEYDPPTSSLWRVASSEGLKRRFLAVFSSHTLQEQRRTNLRFFCREKADPKVDNIS